MIKKLIISVFSFILISNNLYSSKLLEAIKSNHLKVVEDLIKSDINPDYIDIQDNDDGHTALMHACIKGHQTIATTLIEKNADINIQNNTGETALILACKNNNKEIVQMLINANANLNIQIQYGDTALIWACILNNKEIVKMLINANANVYIQDQRGYTTFFYAKDNREILSILNDAKDYKLSNCHCEKIICNGCNLIIENLPILNTNKSKLKDYIKKVEIIINNKTITKKLAIKILNELILFNDKKHINLKNKLRLLDYAECELCNKPCRECEININQLNDNTSDYNPKKFKSNT